MTLPLSHQNGAPVHFPFNVSNNKDENRSPKSGEHSVLKMPALQAQERFLAAFNIGLSARIIINEELKVVEVNNPFKQWFDSSLPVKFYDSRLDELNIFKPSLIKDLQKSLKSVVAGQNVQFMAHLKLNGELRHLQVSVALIAVKSDGTQGQFLIDFNDVTELEQNKSGWSESRLQLGKQEAEFRKVAKVISHDLRAPATNISNLIGLLENTDDSSIDPELLQGLKTSVDAILGTLNNTGFELNSHFNQTLGEVETSIGSCVEGVLESINLELDTKQVEVKFKAYDTSDWEIPEELLKMVLTQLVSNSIKFCSKGKAAVVNITAFKRDGNRIISVVDNGLGIELKGQEQRLFGLFQTFHKHPDARGVGLFQVKNRMKSIGGEVLLESEVGKGTTVTLNFN